MTGADCVVIGSGFGGAVTALRLAEEGWRVVVLERGRPWPPGSFPRRPRHVPRMFWDPPSGRHGYLDVWSFSGMRTVVAAGLGGGSLIYANVLKRKPASTFADEPGERWPLTAADLGPHYARIEALMAPEPYPAALAPYDDVGRPRHLPAAARALGLAAEHPPLAVRFASRPGEAPVPRAPVHEEVANLHGVPRTTCTLCGECDVGCNSGAKESLDVGLLTRARAAGAVLRCLAEARTLQREADGTWTVGYVQHAAGRDGVDPGLLDPDPAERRTITARHVVLAGGAIGTNRLLAANRHVLPGLSPALGRRMSANGDLLGFFLGAREPLDPGSAPVITTSVEVPAERSPSGRAFYVQDGGHPSFVDWLWNLLDAPDQVRAGLSVGWRRVRDRLLGRRDPQLGDELARLAGPGEAAGGMMPFLAMGRDRPTARFTVDDDGEPDVVWDGDAPYFDGVREVAAQLAGELGARFREAPGGGVLCAHPLGGCGLAETPEEGVADPFGRVHGLPGLHVHDGAAMPGPVGPNPSLTIAAVASRCTDALLEDGR